MTDNKNTIIYGKSFFKGEEVNTKNDNRTILSIVQSPRKTQSSHKDVPYTPNMNKETVNTPFLDVKVSKSNTCCLFQYG